MLLIVNPLLPTSKRSLTRDMGVDGNVWWVHSLGVSSHIQKGLSYISLWRLSGLSSSKVLLLHLPITELIFSFALSSLVFYCS
ncbi:hypothetical protein Q3G72_029850 [Acer saccharum]|nr:hypothetical protein Q3G72_029850 [Acer saccharum]